MQRVIFFQVLGFLVALLASWQGPCEAASWRVEKDGSGDFTVIQDAVEAAASGDTVLVGPGQFDDYREYTFPGGDYSVYVNIYKPELTIIGAGKEETIIGPYLENTWHLFDHTIGIKFRGAIELKLEHLAISYVPRGIEVPLGRLEFSYCKILGTGEGMISIAPIVVNYCEFIGTRRTAIMTNGDSDEVIIKNSSFNNCFATFNLTFADFALVENCKILDCTNGGVISRCNGMVRNCQFQNLENSGLGFFGTGKLQVLDNIFENARRSLSVAHGGDNLICENNVFRGAEFFAIGINGDTPSIHNNDIIKGNGFAVLLDSFDDSDPVFVDMSNNYWGTDNPDSIAAWISDGNDEYTHPMAGFVDFEPFRTESVFSEPVPAEKKTLGGFRAMFRGGSQSD